MVKHLEHQMFISLNTKYDSYYCSLCNEWLDPKCEDPDCSYCPKRPDRPMLLN